MRLRLSETSGVVGGVCSISLELHFHEAHTALVVVSAPNPVAHTGYSNSVGYELTYDCSSPLSAVCKVHSIQLDTASEKRVKSKCAQPLKSPASRLNCTHDGSHKVGRASHLMQFLRTPKSRGSTSASVNISLVTEESFARQSVDPDVDTFLSLQRPMTKVTAKR